MTLLPMLFIHLADSLGWKRKTELLIVFTERMLIPEQKHWEEAEGKQG